MAETAETKQRPGRGVAVVAAGALTSQGAGAEALWQGALAGRVAIRPVQHLDMRGLSTKLAGEVDVPADPPRGYRRPADHRERALDLALVAAGEALADLPAGLVEPSRFGLVLGTCNAGLLSARAWLERARRGAPPDPRLPLLATPQALAEGVAAAYGLRGPVLAVNTACASGANAIGLGADLVRRGRADAVLAGGTDALSDVVFAGFNALESLSPEPAAPYSGDRQGLSLGEGSGMVLLVATDFAARHGLRPLAEVAGYGLSADGYHVTAPRPDGSGAAEAIRGALRHAGLPPERVGYVNGHGTGTPKNDPAESAAIARALGPSAARTPVSSTKSVVGHLLGAAGAVEAIVTARALDARTAPPTAGYTRPDPDCPLDYVPGHARPIDAGTDAALSNNFAFAGANAALVLTRPGAHTPPEPDWDRVVVTGVSVLGPAGDGAEAAERAVRDGRAPVHHEAGLRLGRADLPEDGIAPYLTRRQRRRMDRLAVLSVVSTAKALADAGLTADERVGVVFGTGTGPMEAMEKFVLPLFDEGPAAADPSVFPNTVYNQAAGQVATHLGLRGPTSTVSAGHATGAATVAYAADLLSAGHADALVCTVTDTLTEQVARAYAATGAASTRVPGAPADGRFTLAEGSVALVLERLSAARARGATVLGEVLGQGMASDASRARLWDPRGRGLELAMRRALDDAGLGPEGVGEVWLSAAGLTAADRAEEAAVARVFDTADPARHAPKTVLGEPMGVGGALCLALALWTGRSGTGGPALVNSSSLGGSHVSLVVAAGDPKEES
ncbi:beta-ketoacyl-[acyl-carrier-protein] synthase family protein [Streptomyces sp. B1866]|uniref:beta-ketoacyl-[acyl-carrier-protein] synthase family protein n=1 Tax=Streptomyces sp. B1866 TaxID=3075431 RepID=UPI002892355E|nr:beta-ketoacyl-[acyl-carrier-protein] synthase family protein [Streptomyces sp. B1866]MDT3395877.1 beta-ketoacyl-[acyl-carrier-protein] synthase family protein [Streptomyces sp. B1866]